MRLKPYLIATLCVFALSFAACKKSKKGGSTNNPSEEDLKVELVGVVASPTANVSQGPTFPFSVKVTSKMPASGVKIGVEAVVIFSNVSVPQNAAIVSSAATTEVTVNNLPSMNEVRVKVTVTSETKPTNKKEFEFIVFNKV
ncbi:hypothetical protein [uncultured Chitinophaga sp.]|uniref:hypothetical protein n=1 Tax=uncultured Chitinophaga sp. TaxID=339340 RepID=UPI0025FDE3E7|nr:hypothetical protein [uncultured Chitinophaga sp.]